MRWITFPYSVPKVMTLNHSKIMNLLITNSKSQSMKKQRSDTIAEYARILGAFYTLSEQMVVEERPH